MLRWWSEFGFSFLFGTAGAVVPVFNYELYLLGSAWGELTSAAVVAGLALGAGVGKSIVVLLIRAGKRLPWWRAPQEEPTAPTSRKSRFARWWRRHMERLLRLAECPRWTLPLVAVAAATSIPPIYPVSIVVALTKTSWWQFGLAVTFGTAVRATLLLLAARGLLTVF